MSKICELQLTEVGYSIPEQVSQLQNFPILKLSEMRQFSNKLDNADIYGDVQMRKIKITSSSIVFYLFIFEVFHPNAETAGSTVQWSPSCGSLVEMHNSLDVA